MARQLHVLVRDDQYRFLRWESGRTDLSIAHLVRTALDSVYWADFADIDAEFVPEMRPGRPLDPDYALEPDYAPADPLEPDRLLEPNHLLEPDHLVESDHPLEPDDPLVDDITPATGAPAGDALVDDGILVGRTGKARLHELARLVRERLVQMLQRRLRRVRGRRRDDWRDEARRGRERAHRFLETRRNRKRRLPRYACEPP